MLHSRRAKGALFFAASAFALTMATGAAAQDYASSTSLEEVIVTAQKRAENVQDVPASVTSLSGETLAAQQIRDITDLQTHVPSMAVGQLYGANLITLRAISTGLTSGTEDPSVAVHVNGVYQPRSRSLDVALMDLERAEVLAGPQGTLYGRNATGGVVNYITKGPTETFGGEVTALAGNYERYGVRGSVSGPVTDRIGFRLSGMYDDQSKGFTRNILPNAPTRRFEDRRVIGGHAALSFKATDSLRLDLDGMYVDSKTTPLFSLVTLPQVPFFQTLFAPQTTRPHEVASELPARLDSKYGQVSLTATWSLSDNVELKSISAYQNYIDHMDIDNDASGFPGITILQSDKSDTLTQEVDLTVHSFGDRLTSIFGAFYFDDTFKGGSVVPFGIIAPPDIITFYFPTRQTAKSYAVFTDQTLKVTDALRLIAGIRYNKDEKRAVQTGIIAGVGPICPVADVKREWEAWTPRFGAQYDVKDNVMVYAQWQKGFKAGGFTANTCGDDFDPEHIKGPEVGIKSELFNRRLRLNAAAYRYSYTGLQVQQNVAPSVFAVNNAASAVIKGIEVTAQARVTEKLRLDAAAMVQSAKYHEFLNCNQTLFPGACTDADPRPLGQRAQDLAGNWLNRAPPYTVNIGLEYTFDIAGGELLVRGESYWSGKVRYDEFNSAAITQSAFNVQNIYLSYTPEGDRFELRAFVKNVADKDYKVSGFFNAGPQYFTGNWAPPRTFGAEATVNF
jgi:iron complex outermembrane receptor protein